jgi:hypothetical protein
MSLCRAKNEGIKATPTFTFRFLHSLQPRLDFVWALFAIGVVSAFANISMPRRARALFALFKRKLAARVLLRCG